MKATRLRLSILTAHHAFAPHLGAPRGFATAIPNAQTVELSYEVHRSRQCEKDPSTSKSPIIFIHGLFGSKVNFRTIGRHLSHDLNRPVYAVDLRNHGTSPHARPHNYTSMTTDLLSFIDSHALTSPVLIGHSMGAKVAMCAALTEPATIGALIAVDNAPVDAALKTDFASYVSAMRAVGRAKVKNMREGEEVLKAYVKELAVRQFLLMNLKHEVPNKYMTWRIPLDLLSEHINAMGDFPFRDPDETRYEGPTLFVRGTKSPYVADEALPIIGRFFPRFDLVDIDAGHWLISENPGAFRAAVVEFLQDMD